MSDLPPVTREVAPLVAKIGAEATLALVERWGGLRLYVPSPASPDGELWRVVGEDAARYLAHRYGREQIKVPLARNWRILVYHARGLPQAQVARRVGVIERTVERVLSRAKSGRSVQMDFFEP